MLLYRGDAALFNFTFTIFKLQEDSISRTPSRIGLLTKILSPTFTEVSATDLIENACHRCPIDDVFVAERRSYWRGVLAAEVTQKMQTAPAQGGARRRQSSRGSNGSSSSGGGGSVSSDDCTGPSMSAYSDESGVVAAANGAGGGHSGGAPKASKRLNYVDAQDAGSSADMLTPLSDSASTSSGYSSDGDWAAADAAAAGFLESMSTGSSSSGGGGSGVGGSNGVAEDGSGSAAATGLEHDPAVADVLARTADMYRTSLRSTTTKGVTYMNVKRQLVVDFDGATIERCKQAIQTLLMSYESHTLSNVNPASSTAHVPATALSAAATTPEERGEAQEAAAVPVDTASAPAAHVQPVSLASFSPPPDALMASLLMC